ncbi:kinase-like domain-containing protein [Dipodascopsis tothii]|uniref:kinase-like domain-containing protein n=1 Tax=Dipodascopsis tothii TaxID=44089 RepID=UPI0034CF8FE4
MASTLVPPTSSYMASKRRKRTPNWEEFYRNGYPTDVIVIEDDTPPPPASDGPLADAKRQFYSTAAPPDGRRGRDNYTLIGSPNVSLFDLGGGLTSPTTALKRQRDAAAHYAATSTAAVVPVPPLPERAPITVHDVPTDVDSTLGKKRKLEYAAPKKPVCKAKDVVVQAITDPFVPREKLDDDDGHYIIVPNSEFTSRYTITKLLGQGTFGKVVEAYDHQKRSSCAIKIIRAVQKYRDASKIELRVLSTLSMHDQQNVNRCIHLRDCFDYRNHICIVTDLLGISVFDFLKSNSFVPFPASHIQQFAKQLLTSVMFLHELNLIHTDLKPENILLVNSAYDTYPYNERGIETRKVLKDTTIHLIDFGSATFQDEYHSSVVSTRHYRAPEIILSMGWSFPCDMWSIGCILVEFFTGEALFQTHDNLEHLAMMETIVGRPFDRAQSKLAGRQARKYFLRNGKLDYPNTQTSKTSKKYVKAMKTLDEMIPVDKAPFYREFVDLLRRIFVYNPEERLTAKDALNHAWFRQDPPLEDFEQAAQALH